MYENRSLFNDWDVLRLVLYIERFGGVSGAARAMKVTHATISRRLAKAEESSGVVFFDRLPAGLRLTKAGEAILKHAQRIEPEFDALERQLTAYDDELAGALRITIPPLMMITSLREAVVDFATKYPMIKLEFAGDNNLLNLHQREADVAIRITRKPPETLWGRKLTDQHAGYYAATNWLEKHWAECDDLLLDLPIISFSTWSTLIPKTLSAIYPNAKSVAVSDDMITAIELVRAGLGITRMPRVIGDALHDLDRVSTIPWEPYSPVWLLTHPDIKRAPKVELFMKFVADHIRDQKSAYVAPTS